MDFSSTTLTSILDKIDAGEAEWDAIEPLVKQFAPMLDSLFHLQPSHPAVVGVIGSLPAKGSIFTITHMLELIDKGDADWEMFEPLIRQAAPIVDAAIHLFHPSHPAVVAAIAALPTGH